MPAWTTRCAPWSSCRRAGRVPPTRPVTAERLATGRRSRPSSWKASCCSCAGVASSLASAGPDGGYWLARPAERHLAGRMIRVIDGPLANVRGQRPEELGYQGAAAALQEVWIALRASEREILELVTLADVATGELPKRVRALAANPHAWI